MTKQEISGLKPETKLSVLTHNVLYAEQAYERMLEMQQFVENDIRYMYETLKEDVGEEELRTMLEKEEPDFYNKMNSVCDRWEDTLKLIECFKIMKSLNL
jgi:hypothetical protein